MSDSFPKSRFSVVSVISRSKRRTVRAMLVLKLTAIKVGGMVIVAPESVSVKDLQLIS